MTVLHQSQSQDFGLVSLVSDWGSIPNLDNKCSKDIKFLDLAPDTFSRQNTYTQTPSIAVKPWKLVKCDPWTPNGRKSIECSHIGTSWVAGPDGGIVHTECWAKQCASLMYSATETPLSSDKHTDKIIFSIVAIHNSSVVRALIHCSKKRFITWGVEAYCVWRVCNTSL